MLTQKVMRVKQLMLVLIALLGFTAFDGDSFAGIGVKAQ